MPVRLCLHESMQGRSQDFLKGVHTQGTFQVVMSTSMLCFVFFSDKQYFLKSFIYYKLLYSSLAAYQWKCLLVKSGVDDEWKRRGHGTLGPPSGYTLDSMH